MNDNGIWEALDELLDRYDADVSFECASACAWSGQLRVTLTDPEGAPSRSMTFYSAGGADPAAVAARVLDDFGEWLRESVVEPLPVPDWMR